MKQWLDKAGRYKVDRLSGARRTMQQVDMAAPPKGILHTTEGGWGSSLSVFESRLTTPTFMVGRDDGRKVRIAQLIPLGEMAAALENDRGGVETNRVCRVQIEIVAFSQHTLWLPEEPVAKALAALMLELNGEAGIPYRHAVANRNPRSWIPASGWLGHEDVPENVHWDPGNLRWDALFALAGGQHEDPYWLWLRWRLGEGEFKRFGGASQKHRPTILPDRVPKLWWDRLKAFQSGRTHGPNAS